MWNWTTSMEWFRLSLQQEKKAKKALEKITTVDEKTWLLPSASDETKMHTVQIIKSEYDCDCLGFQHTLNCYHVMAVKMLNGEAEKWKVKNYKVN